VQPLNVTAQTPPLAGAEGTIVGLNCFWNAIAQIDPALGSGCFANLLADMKGAETPGGASAQVLELLELPPENDESAEASLKNALGDLLGNLESETGADSIALTKAPTASSTLSALDWQASLVAALNAQPVSEALATPLAQSGPPAALIATYPGNVSESVETPKASSHLVDASSIGTLTAKSEPAVPATQPQLVVMTTSANIENAESSTPDVPLALRASSSSGKRVDDRKRDPNADVVATAGLVSPLPAPTPPVTAPAGDAGDDAAQVLVVSEKTAAEPALSSHSPDQNTATPQAPNPRLQIAVTAYARHQERSPKEIPTAPAIPHAPLANAATTAASISISDPTLDSASAKTVTIAASSPIIDSAPKPAPDEAATTAASNTTIDPGPDHSQAAVAATPISAPIDHPAPESIPAKAVSTAAVTTLDPVPGPVSTKAATTVESAPVIDPAPLQETPSVLLGTSIRPPHADFESQRETRREAQTTRPAKAAIAAPQQKASPVIPEATLMSNVLARQNNSTNEMVREFFTDPVAAVPPAPVSRKEAARSEDSSSALSSFATVEIAGLGPSGSSLDPAMGSFQPLQDLPRHSLDQLVNTTVMQADLIANGTSQRFSMRLDPPSLGKMVIEIHRDKGGAVAVHVSAASPHTHALLEQHGQEISQALHDQGLSLSNLDLSQQQQQPGQGDSQDHSAAADFQEAARQRSSAGTSSPVSAWSSSRTDSAINFRA
jgi:flagellar hook-length control protein FliK